MSRLTATISLSSASPWRWASLVLGSLVLLAACGDDGPVFPDTLLDVSGDGTTSDVPTDDVVADDAVADDVPSDGDSDTPGPDGTTGCEPSCDTLGRGACVDGVCGECDDGLTSTGGADAICCAAGEFPSADGLSCELAPECQGVSCVNGGVCVALDGAGICDCPAGTSGDDCGTVCESDRLWVTSCEADGQDCLGWLDASAPTPFNGGGCDELPCFFDDDECAEGCINFTIVLDLGGAVAVETVEWRADWWSQRPESVTVFAGPTENIREATEVGTIAGMMHPWQCVTGEACDESVPNECCPDGRDAPQRIEEGALLSKWDSAELEAVGGRYFFFRVDRTFRRDAVIMQDMRVSGTDCVGGLACDPEVEDCREPCPAGTERDGDECVDIDGCRDNPCFDGVACSDVAAPSTGFECGPCPEGLEGDGITCTSVDCTPECADWESCVSGSCQPRRCSEGCGSGTCFEGVCGNAGTCESQCASRYGSGDTWECVDQGYCRKVNCRRGTECGSGVDCVSDPDNNSRGPGGGGVFDQTCVGGGSPCGGTCDGLCSATSGRCLG